MGTKPPDKTTNRFSLLSEIPTKKHKSNTPRNPPLPTIKIILPNPKYVIISSAIDSQPLSQISPFVLKKCIDGISTEIEKIDQLRDGSILILTRNEKIADRFLKVKILGNIYPVHVKLHETLNSVKGVAYAPCLTHVEESEIVQEMKPQGVISVYKFTRLVEGKQVPTGKVVFTFDLYRLPETIDVAWYKVKVTPYIPNPMRCKQCQLLGHTQKRCKNNPSCDGCNLPRHNPEKCTRSMCANCMEEHSSSDKKCPKFIQAKAILKIKAEEYCSMSEARKRYKELNPINITTLSNSFASMAKSAQTNNNNQNKPEKSTSILSPNTVSKTSTFNALSHSITSQNSLSLSNTIDITDKPTLKTNSASTSKTNPSINTLSTSSSPIITLTSLPITSKSLQKPSFNNKDNPSNIENNIIKNTNTTYKELPINSHNISDIDDDDME